MGIVNEFLEEINFQEEADLVGITTLTTLANRAYEIVDRFRERGVPVILGGVHATFMPEEGSARSETPSGILFAEQFCSEKGPDEGDQAIEISPLARVSFLTTHH